MCNKENSVYDLMDQRSQFCSCPKKHGFLSKKKQIESLKQYLTELEEKAEDIKEYIGELETSS
jgi:hypothetical protein